MIDLLFEVIGILSSPIIQKVHRNEAVIRLLKKCNLDPTHPPEDFEGIYLYSLIEYATHKDGQRKPESVLNLFRLPNIRDAFYRAFCSGDSSIVHKEIDNMINGKELNKNISSQNLKEEEIDLEQELTEFTNTFIKVVERSQKPAHRQLVRQMDNLQEKLDKLTTPEINTQNFQITGFEALIKEKTRYFCGRKFVFEEFNKFLDTHQYGYFTLIGDAGMGKSAIAAKYVSDHNAIHFFNILAESRNRPEQFLNSIRQQLIARYQLQHVEEADLSTLITRASEKIPDGERLVIVVDALDEVDQENKAENLLFLPSTLPEGVYFFLTRRPHNFDKKRLNVSVPTGELNLTLWEYEELSKEDVKEYINLFLREESQHKLPLTKWIQERDIKLEVFIETVANKSENNFMYLFHILRGIARGFYENLTLKELPDGLQDYYQIHWIRMSMDDKPQEMKVIILFVLVEIGLPIPLTLLAEIINEDEYDVQQILDEWIEYLRLQEIEGEMCYGIYHASFLEFLKNKREFKPTRKLFDFVNEQISLHLY